MHRLTIPQWTDNKTGEFHPERNLTVKLVDTLLANFPPPHDLVFKYYGVPPVSAFKPTEHDRLVFWSDETGYIIVPNSSRNKGLWEKCVKN